MRCRYVTKFILVYTEGPQQLFCVLIIGDVQETHNINSYVSSFQVAIKYIPKEKCTRQLRMVIAIILTLKQRGSKQEEYNHAMVMCSTF